MLYLTLPQCVQLSAGCNDVPLLSTAQFPDTTWCFVIFFNVDTLLVSISFLVISSQPCLILWNCLQNWTCFLYFCIRNPFIYYIPREPQRGEGVLFRWHLSRKHCWIRDVTGFLGPGNHLKKIFFNAKKKSKN